MLKQYYRFSQAVGVSIHVNNDGSFSADICSVTVEKDQLNFAQKISGLTSFNEITSKLPPNALVSLNLSGKGVITKQSELLDELNAANFSKIIPGIKFEDFYIQHFPSGNNSFVSIIRKQEADTWLNRLSEAGLRPLMLSLDIIPVSHILPQLNIYDQDITLRGNLISRNAAGEWLNIGLNNAESAAFQLKIGDEPVKESLILPYAAVFQLVLSDELVPLEANVPAMATALKTQREHRKFQVHGVLVLIIFFVLLLANFLFLNYLNTSNGELYTRSAVIAQSASNRDTLEQQISQKEDLLKQAGWRKGTRFSTMIDQLAAVLPEEVHWSAIAVNPLDDARTRNSKMPVFTDHQITITGKADQIIPVNEWLARIRTRPWVKNVQLVSYNYNYEQQTGIFTIGVTY